MKQEFKETKIIGKQHVASPHLGSTQTPCKGVQGEEESSQEEHTPKPQRKDLTTKKKGPKQGQTTQEIRGERLRKDLTTKLTSWILKLVLGLTQRAKLSSPKL